MFVKARDNGLARCVGDLRLSGLLSLDLLDISNCFKKRKLNKLGLLIQSQYFLSESLGNSEPTAGAVAFQ